MCGYKAGIAVWLYVLSTACNHCCHFPLLVSKLPCNTCFSYTAPSSSLYSSLSSCFTHISLLLYILTDLQPPQTKHCPLWDEQICVLELDVLTHFWTVLLPYQENFSWWVRGISSKSSIEHNNNYNILIKLTDYTS